LFFFFFQLQLTPVVKNEENIKDPIFRCFEREISQGVKLLQKVKKDLSDLKLVCEGQLKQTNYLRSLIQDTNRGIF